MDNMRRTFYSMTQKDGLTGVMLRDGYEVELGGRVFYAYRSNTNGNVYIIDPDTGLAVSSYRYRGSFFGEPTETDLIERAKEKLLESGELENWGAIRTKKIYFLAVRTFRAYLLAERLWGRQTMAVRFEQEKARGWMLP